MSRIEISPRDAETIANSTWYVATTGKGEFFGFWQPFTRLRSVGDVYFSRNIYGFRVYQHPYDIADEPYAKMFFPWTLWRVTPIDIVRTWRLPDEIHARRLHVEEKLPAGAEFGRYGARVRGFADALAQLDIWPAQLHSGTLAGREHHDALVALDRATPSVFSGNLFRQRRFAFSYVRRQIVSTRRPKIGHDAVRAEIEGAETELESLVLALITGTTVPPTLATRWSLPPEVSAGAATAVTG